MSTGSIPDAVLRVRAGRVHRKLAVVASRATSLLNVAKDIAYVAKKMKLTPVVFDYMPSPVDLARIASGAIVVSPVNPLTSRPWLLFSRDLNKDGIPSFIYATVEGRLPSHLVRDWMRNEVYYVANSRYTARRLEEVGITVLDTVPHGVNFEDVGHAKQMVQIVRRKIEEKLGKGIIVGTVATAHPRKGLDLYAEAVRLVRQRNRDVKFYILSTQMAPAFFAGVDGVYVDTSFGGHSKTEVLALIGAFDVYVQPSLAEGFGLPVLEAMAMGRIAVHPAYEPLTEFSPSDANIWVPVERVAYDSFGEGLEYELHIYQPKDMAQAILEAAELASKRRDEYLERARKAEARAREHDVEKLYPKLIHMVGEIERLNE